MSEALDRVKAFYAARAGLGKNVGDVVTMAASDPRDPNPVKALTLTDLAEVIRLAEAVDPERIRLAIVDLWRSPEGAQAMPGPLSGSPGGGLDTMGEPLALGIHRRLVAR